MLAIKTSRKRETISAPDRTPLYGVAVKLATKRSSLHSVSQQPIASDILSPRAAFDGVTSIRPSCSFEPLSTAWRFLAQYFQTGLAAKNQRFTDIRTEFNTEASILQKTMQPHPAAPTRITSPQSNARRDPTNGQARRRPCEPPGSGVPFCIDYVSITLRQEGVAKSLFLHYCRTRRMEPKSIHLSLLGSSPRSSRTEEVAR